MVMEGQEARRLTRCKESPSLYKHPFLARTWSWRARQLSSEREK